MYIVNTSFFVESDAQQPWLDVMTGKYIPFLEQNGYRVIAFSRVVSEGIPDHFTYTLMVDVPDMGSYSKLTGEMFGEYRTLADAMFGQRVTWLTTLMKKITRS